MGAQGPSHPNFGVTLPCMRPFLSLALLCAVAASYAQTADQSVQYEKLIRDAQSAFSTNKMSEASTLYGEAVKIFDQDGDVQWKYGQALLNVRKLPEGIDALKRALALGGFANKYASVVEYDLACAYSLQNDIENGYLHLERAMSLGWRDLDHLRSDTDLESLRKDKRWAKVALLGDVAKMSRTEGWRYDLMLMDNEARRKHFSPYTRHPKSEFDDYVKKLSRDIPKLTDNQIRAGFVKYMAMFGDGHTSVRPTDRSAPEAQQLPIQPFWFKEGVFVTLAAPGSESLTGAQILKVEGQPVDLLLEKVRPYCSYENEQGYRAGSVGWLVRPGFLQAIGVAKSAEQLTLTIRDAKGAERDVTIQKTKDQPSAEWPNARSASGNPDPLYMKQRATPFWFEALPEKKMLYFQYNAVQNMPKESTEAFAGRLAKELEGDIETLVVDVRWNGGGNSFLNVPLEHTILKCKQNKRGHLFIITGRNTYSACQNFSTDLDRETEAIFVGEPTGSSPNFIGESVRTTLPYSKMTMSISDLYWQRSWPMDSRSWIAPTLPAEPTFAVFKENRDPAMEAILAYLAAGK